MDILKCLVKLMPGWRGAVWNNSYDGIRPHELETRPIPSLAELEAVWPIIQKEEADAVHDEAIKASLADIDLKSIRALREWLAQQKTAPQWIQDYEVQAVAERAKLVRDGKP
jgi:hypothetical protein